MSTETPNREASDASPASAGARPTPAPKPTPPPAPVAAPSPELMRILGTGVAFEQPGKLATYRVPVSDLANAARKLQASGYDYLLFMTAVDYPLQNIFELLYVLSSFKGAEEIALACQVPRLEPRAPTLSDIWATAEWHERETYDLFGIQFEGHPDLRRILLDDTWTGHPLRKDYVDQGHQVIKRPY